MNNYDSYEHNLQGGRNDVMSSIAQMQKYYLDTFSQNDESMKKHI